MTEVIFTNARVITPDRVVDGTLLVRDGRIAALQEGASAVPGTVDLGGDYLLPGLIELHTDNLERHLSPRPGVRWPRGAAVLAHDAQIVAAGITTVFDAISLGEIFAASGRVDSLSDMYAGLQQAQKAGVLKADHRLHLRCELSFAGVLDLFESLMDERLVGLVSIMDHTPGQRQFTDVVKYRTYYKKKYGLSDTEFEVFLADRRADSEKYSAYHREAIVNRARERGLTLASHDDATTAHVAESAAAGMRIAEFPTTMEAARASREQGLAVLMGAPNVVLGGSHSGNIAASDLAARGLLDILSSDYVPASLIPAAFALAEGDNKIGLLEAIRMISCNPASALGLDDRGAIVIGRRSDLVRVRVAGGLPVVREVWREGVRVV